MKYLDNLIAWGDQLFRPRHDRVDQRGDAALRARRRDPRAAAAGRARPRAIPAVRTYDDLDGSLDALLERAGRASRRFLPPSAARRRTGNGRPAPAADRLLLHAAERQAARLLGHRRRSAVQDPPLHEHRGRRAPAAAVRAADRSGAARAGGRRGRRPRRACSTTSTRRSRRTASACCCRRRQELCGEVKALGAGAAGRAREARRRGARAAAADPRDRAARGGPRGRGSEQIDEAKSNLEALQKTTTPSPSVKLGYYRARGRSSTPFETAAPELAAARVSILQAVQGELETIAVGILFAHARDQGRRRPRPSARRFGGEQPGATRCKAISAGIGGRRWRSNNVQGTMASTLGGYERRQRRLEAPGGPGRQGDSRRSTSRSSRRAPRRRSPSTSSRTTTRQIENAKQVDEFMRDKFTNQELYDWMIGQIAGRLLPGLPARLRPGQARRARLPVRAGHSGDSRSSSSATGTACKQGPARRRAAAARPQADGARLPRAEPARATS